VKLRRKAEQMVRQPTHALRIEFEASLARKIGDPDHRRWLGI
jgi:hypothetical protein